MTTWLLPLLSRACHPTKCGPGTTLVDGDCVRG